MSPLQIARLGVQTKATNETKDEIISTRRGDDNHQGNKIKRTWSEYKQKLKIPKKWGKRKNKINKRSCSKHRSRRQSHGHKEHIKRSQ